MKRMIGTLAIASAWNVAAAHADTFSLRDLSGLEFKISHNLLISTTSSASGAATEASYSAAVAATTVNGGTSPARLGDAFDGYAGLLINPGPPPLARFAYNNNGVASLACSGREVVLNPQVFGNLIVCRKVYVPADDEFCRFLNIITNNGSATETVTIRICSNLGSDSRTRFVSSSDGDSIGEASDLWVTSFEEFSGTTSNDPRLGHVIQGPGAPVPVSAAIFSDSDDNPTWDYRFNLLPGQTGIIMHFVTGQPSRAAAAAKAAELATLPPSALRCISPTELGQILNVSTLWACCFPNGACLNLPPQDCLHAGGEAGGSGSNCASYNCNPLGACCLPDGSCIGPTSPNACALEGGVFQGDQTTCATVNCPQPQAACCFPNGFCLLLTRSDCELVGATWHYGSTCADANGNGAPDVCESESCDADLNSDRRVDLQDLATLLTHFGTASGATFVDGDLDDDADVDLQDLATLLAEFGAVCP